MIWFAILCDFSKMKWTGGKKVDPAYINADKLDKSDF